MKNNSSPLNFLHWTSPLFDVLSHIRQFVIPTIFALLGAAGGNNFWLWIAALFLIPSVASAIVRFLTLRYSIRDCQLVVSQGLFFRNVRTVPVERIQNIDFVQNVLHRLFGVAEVRIETAGGGGPEALLRVLTLDQINRLRAEIFDLKQASDGVSESIRPAPADVVFQHEQAVPLLSIPIAWLVQAGIANNRGLLLLGIAVGAFFQFDFQERIEKMDVKWLESLRPIWDDQMLLALFGAAAVIGLLILLRVISVLWYILRFYDYKLVRCGEDLQVSCGLLTRVSATVPRRRIQLISVHRNLLMRWMGLSAIRIETAGTAFTAGEGTQKISLSGRWFIPIMPNDRVSELMSQLRQGLNWDEEQTALLSLPRRAVTRSVRKAILGSAVIGAALMVTMIAWSNQAGIPILKWLSWLPGLSLIVLSTIQAICRTRAVGYARTADGVIYRSGVFTQKTSVTFFEKIQAITTVQTPFDHRWRMARLTIDTAAAGQADHRIDIPMLEKSFALGEKEKITRLAALHQPSFT